ncbi:MAG: hypothetical protein OC190_05880 [Novosphingobium aromaticivorans]|jgi:hypothetical protein|nr:hypothetical protein [Novosphingobium aromaticivorans]
MLRYLICFVAVFALSFLLLRPNAAEYARRHSESVSLLDQVNKAPLHVAAGVKFYFQHRRYGHDSIYWLSEGRKSEVMCIRCPVPLDEVAEILGSVTYARLADGQQVAVEMRDRSNRTLLSRQLALAILRENAHETAIAITDEKRHAGDWGIAFFVALIAAILGTLCYAGIRAKDHHK